MAHVLDLLVPAADEDQIPVLVQPADVAGAVAKLAALRVRRVRDQGRSGADRVLIVPRHDRGPADDDLALVGEPPLVVQEVQLRAGEGLPYGHGPIRGLGADDGMVEAHARALRGPVELEDPGVGTGLLPGGELLHGEDLAAEAHELEMLRHHGVEGPKAGHQAEGGGHPAEGVDLPLVDIFDQGHRVHEQLPGQEVGRGPLDHDPQQLLEPGVEIEGGLDAENQAFVEIQRDRQGGGVVEEGALPDGDPLRLPGGAGGEDHVGEGVLCALLPKPVRAREGRRPAVDQMLRRRAQALRRGQILLVREDEPGVQGPDDAIEALPGHLLVQGHVEAARLQDPQKGRDLKGAPLHEHAHGLGLGAAVQEAGPHVGRRPAKLREGEARLPVGEGQLVRQPVRRVIQVG